MSTAATDVAFTVCKKAVSGSAQPDQMVKVGDFWIDRYEAAVCGNGSLGLSDGYSTTAVACSVSGVQPTQYTTWFQAQQMCVNAGKELCSNEEWQAAVSGTNDPGSWPASSNCYGSQAATAGPCNTCSPGPRATGLGGAAASGSCFSTFGAEDMIGNLEEWTSGWSQSGTDSSFTPAQGAAPWPTGYGDGEDDTFNIDGSTFERGDGGFVLATNVPSAFTRGGTWFEGTGAGAFAVSTYYGLTLGEYGLRCCVRGR